MDKRMLIFDLDDTLLTSEKTITPRSVQAIKCCKKRGMIIGYITGRARPMRGEVFYTEKYDLPKDFISYYNGAESYAGDVFIESNAIPYENAMKIIKGLIKTYPNIRISVKQQPWSYLKRSGCPEGENWNIGTGEKVKCGVLELPRYDFQRIRIEFDQKDDRDKLDRLLTEDTISFINVDGSAMIIHKNATKERALKKASEYFEIPLCDVITFGDDINDIHMLKISGMGVAMGNAIDAVKEIADFVTETNDNDGISAWINKYLLADGA